MQWNELHTIVPVFEHIIKRICTPNWHIARQKCEYHNIMFFTNGSGSVTINNSTYPVQKGSLVYIPKGELRELCTSSTKPLEYFGVNFLYTTIFYEDNRWNQIDMPLSYHTHQVVTNSILFSRLKALFNQLNTAWVGSQAYRQLRCKISFMEILQLMIDWQNKKNIVPTSTSDRVQEIINYMSVHYTENITLAGLSSIFNISASYLDYMFRQHTGKSPLQYLLHIKINNAIQLLLENNSVTQAAVLSGFNDIYYFSRYFKKIIGYSPSEFKRLNI